MPFKGYRSHWLVYVTYMRNIWPFYGTAVSPQNTLTHTYTFPDKAMHNEKDTSTPSSSYPFVKTSSSLAHTDGDRGGLGGLVCFKIDLVPHVKLQVPMINDSPPVWHYFPKRKNDCVTWGTHGITEWMTQRCFTRRSQSEWSDQMTAVPHSTFTIAITSCILSTVTFDNPDEQANSWTGIWIDGPLWQMCYGMMDNIIEMSIWEQPGQKGGHHLVP